MLSSFTNQGMEKLKVLIALIDQEQIVLLLE